MQFGRLLPYRFVPPAPRPWLARVLRPYIRHRVLGRKLDIQNLRTQNIEPFLELHRRGDALTITANHPDHADGWAIAWGLLRTGLGAYYLTDYANFTQQNALNVMALAAHGTFSINPHDFDPKSFDCSFSILTGQNPRRAILFFPEGDIYMHNDVAGVYRHGAFFLTVRAARHLREMQSNRRVFVAPVAVKFTLMADARPALEGVVAALQDDLGITREPLGADPLPTLRRLGVSAANHSIVAAGCELPVETPEDLPGVIRQVLAELEAALDLPASADATPDHALLLVCRAYYRRFNAGPIPPEAKRLGQKIAIAKRLASYAPGYACAHPTLDRIGEVISNLYEDLHNERLRLGMPRACVIRGAEPIEVAPLLRAAGPKREVIRGLAVRTRDATQSMLDQINAENTHPGGRLWSEQI